MPGLVANFHLIRKEKFSSEAWLLRSADPIDKHDVATTSSSILVWIFLLKLYVACVITFLSFFFTEKSISKKASWHGVRLTQFLHGLTKFYKARSPTNISFL